MDKNKSNPISPRPGESLGQDDYKLLRGHHRTDGTFKNDEQLRSEYVRLTDELIRKMTEGVEFTDRETGEVRVERPDAVVWLDKSARPVSWLTKKLWPKLAQDNSGAIPEMPKFYYVNIDREQWVDSVDPDNIDYMDVTKVGPGLIRGLRSIFVAPHLKRGGLNESIDGAETALDGKNVLIVDEVRATGRTLSIAQRFFNAAFPEARFAGAHWMGGLVKKGGATGNADLPVWYKEGVESGRGVGNRDEIISRKSRSLTQRLGGMFLGTVIKGSDEASTQLRQEISQLSREVGKGVLYVPSLEWDVDKYDDRATTINGLGFEEFLTKKQKLDSSNYKSD